MTLTIEAPFTTEVKQPETVKPTKTVADVLEHAALIIEERGWTQNGYQSEGAVCAIGAIGIASIGVADAYSFANHKPSQQPIIDLLALQVGDWPPQWNDKPGRTAAEVTAALRAAAKAAR